jgi:drug/metabolite transporter (DMT)-like permease
MWLVLSFGSAICYAAIWLLARGSRGIPPAIVASLQGATGPVVLAIGLLASPPPWKEPWLLPYLVLPFILMPLTFWGLTVAAQRTDVTIIKPLSALSTLATLAVAVGIFGGSFPALGLLGIAIITGGLLLLYHGRWQEWRSPYPWLTLPCIAMLGINAAIIRELLIVFPHPFIFSGFNLTGAFLLNGMIAGKDWGRTHFDRKTILFLLIFALFVLGQDFGTIFALLFAPAPYVIAIKRTSILLATVGAYIFFQERETKLPRLVFSCIIVIVGVSLLTLT